MTIQSISLNLSGKNINFGKKHKKEYIRQTETRNTQKVPAAKLYPAMLAMAGLMTLNGCSEDYKKFKDVDNLKNEYYETGNKNAKEKTLALENIKTFSITNNKDSISTENKYFKFNAIRIKSDDHTLVFSNGERKEDGKKFSAISKYDQNGKILNTIISDPDTDEKFIVRYKDNGKIETVKNKNGEDVKDKDLSALGIFLLFIIAGGLFMMSKPINK